MVTVLTKVHLKCIWRRFGEYGEMLYIDIDLQHKLVCIVCDNSFKNEHEIKEHENI